MLITALSVSHIYTISSTTLDKYTTYFPCNYTGKSAERVVEPPMQAVIGQSL
jgi:hypothetical protein